MIQTLLAKLTAQMVIYIVGAALITGVVGVAYYSWKSRIEQQAVNELTIKQFKEAQAELEAQQKVLDDIKLAAAQIRWQMQQQNAAVDKLKEDLNQQIDSAPDDRPASDVLKNVVKRLGGQK